MLPKIYIADFWKNENKLSNFLTNTQKTNRVRSRNSNNFYRLFCQYSVSYHLGKKEKVFLNIDWLETLQALVAYAGMFTYILLSAKCTYVATID